MRSSPTPLGDTMPDQDLLRDRVLTELAAAGFTTDGTSLTLPEGDAKDVARALHSAQRNAVLRQAADFIFDYEDALLVHFADGREVNPADIQPRIAPVSSDLDAALFQFASLHWTVPVSQGYGRRNRFLIWDESTDKLVGIFALGDPVFNLRARDHKIAWTGEQRQHRLYNVFDAYVLGAVEPYRRLLGGKLAALCAVSEEVLGHLERKYAGVTTVIKKETKGSRPALITTTSALGRSSIYNRLTMNGSLVYEAAGYTEGFGHFQFSEQLFEDLRTFASSRTEVRGNAYGRGPNWRMRTLRTALETIGLPGDLLKHGIQREVFLAPVAANWKEYLRGEVDNLVRINRPLDEIAEHYRRRWAIPRAQRRGEYIDWQKDGMRLTPTLEEQLAAPLRLF